MTTRCGNICVPCKSDDRLNISFVVQILSTKGAIPQPKEYVFSLKGICCKKILCKIRKQFSGNEHTITLLEG